MEVQTPTVGDHALRILSPDLLELWYVNTKQPGATNVDGWDWVDTQQMFTPPPLSQIRVFANGQLNSVAEVGFKRRALYAPLLDWDLRIGNQLYLKLRNPIPENAVVRVVNDGSWWPTNILFEATAHPLRYNPAIHVNQEGYLPSYAKQAVVGYYLGDLGEMPVPTNKFFIVQAEAGTVLYEGTLTPRPDVGFSYSPTPYQKVYEANFTSLTIPGEYRVVIPGMGGSLPFLIDEGVAMAFARTYAQGLYEQRSGMAVEMPFTRFTHAPDHTTPASVPANASAPFAFTWQTISNYSSETSADNPPQIAPLLTNFTAQLFPFVNQGTVAVTGGHFEAGDYNRVTYNGAQLIHLLVFGVDSLPGVGALDNLGIPESGDGISDALQEAKWEADFLVRMQDADGGFYFSVYPQYREYEFDVLPENGDPEVVWPKNTATTAAAVAALAQCASSPRFKQAYPQAATNYLSKAVLGWRFLTNSIARFGFEGSYQKIQHFDEEFTHRDELAWAACELFLATHDAQYESKLLEWFPDPADYRTFRWGWRRMVGSYGNAIRDYAFAVASGKISSAQVRNDYLLKCINTITNAGNDILLWSQHNAYGTSFPDLTKAYRGGGWYFSVAQAFDLVVAYQLNPKPEILDALLRNMNYEAGCNPVNVCYLTGLGWKRQRNVVDQYSLNDRRVLPKNGIPISNLQAGFLPVWVYGWELMGLSYPADSLDVAPYAYYDRWSDDWNVSTEGSTTDTARSFSAVAWLVGRTALGGTSQPWRFTAASISGTLTPRLPALPVALSLNAPDTSSARIIWEAKGQQPQYGGTSYTFVPGPAGDYWVEAEAQWPDGRRAFAKSSVTVSPNAPPELLLPQRLPGSAFTFTLAGTPSATYVIQVSQNLANWTSISTNTIPSWGSIQITDTQAGSSSARYYRALKL